jgi:hypothetical protein
VSIETLGEEIETAIDVFGQRATNLLDTVEETANNVDTLRDSLDQRIATAVEVSENTALPYLFSNAEKLITTQTLVLSLVNGSTL